MTGTPRVIRMTGPATADRSRWLRTLTEPAEHGPAAGPVRLVCFPHAGGTARSFAPWSDLPARGVELVGVQYPGRQDRIDEPCATTMAKLAGPLADALTPWAGPRLALLGHSMGAAVAAEVAARLERRTGGPLLRLFVSGRPAPGTRRPGTVHPGGDEALLADLRRLGGTDAALLDNPALRDLVLPSLRADYRLIETYEGKQPSYAAMKLTTPTTALTGDRDPEVTPEEADAWRRFSGGGFRVRVFPGGHFYLTDRPRAVLAAVLADLGQGAPSSGLGWPSTP